MKETVAVFVFLSVTLLGLAHAGTKSSHRTYGWELEFSNTSMLRAKFGEQNAQASAVNDAARERWIKVIREICAERGNCRISEIEDWVSWRKGNGEVVWSWEIASYRITYNDGWWFQLSYDPNIVEVQLKPSTVDDLRRNKERMQRDIFNTAKRVKLTPPKNVETHLHTGAESAFNLELHKLRNFIVDGVNHGEWVFLFAASFDNGPPLRSVLPKEQHDAFARIIADVDAGRIADVDTFVKRIRERVYHSTLDEEMHMYEGDTPQKYQHYNIERLKKKVKIKDKTVENRAVPHPQNADDVVLLTNLQDSRIEYLNTKFATRNVPLLPYQPKASFDERIASFREYVKEAGMKFSDFKKFILISCERKLMAKRWTTQSVKRR